MASLTVFSKGGYVLYQHGKVEGNGLNRLVSEHLLEARPLPEYVTGGQTIKWKSDNDRDVIYAVRHVLYRAFFVFLTFQPSLARFADGAAAETFGRRLGAHRA